MRKYFPKQKPLEGNVKVELYLPSYPTKTDLKNAAGVNTSKYTKNVELASSKSEFDKLDIDKLQKVPTG